MIKLTRVDYLLHKCFFSFLLFFCFQCNEVIKVLIYGLISSLSFQCTCVDGMNETNIHKLPYFITYSELRMNRSTYHDLNNVDQDLIVSLQLLLIVNRHDACLYIENLTRIRHGQPVYFWTGRIVSSNGSKWFKYLVRYPTLLSWKNCLTMYDIVIVS